MGQKRHSLALGTFLGEVFAVNRPIKASTRYLNSQPAAPAPMATVCSSP